MKKGLGKGLDSLFKNFEEDNNTIIAKEIKIELIAPNENQPRKIFDADALQELSDSIKQHGVIQPIVVNKNIGTETYTIIAGERRYRASRMAGLKTIPCIIKDYTDKEVREISIIENLQREDLNPIETARAIKELMDDYDWTQEEVADRLGKSRSSIANSVRLLNLEPEVINMLESGELSAGVARPLIGKERNLQLKLAKQASEKRLTARFMEMEAKKDNKKQQHQTPKQQSLELKDFAKKLALLLGTKVIISGDENRGEIKIEYFSREDLENLYELLIHKIG